MRGSGDDLSCYFEDFAICRGPFSSSVIVDGMVVVGCEVVGVGLVDLEVLVLEINSSFRGYYCLELGGVEEWTSSEVNMVDVTGGF